MNVKSFWIRCALIAVIIFTSLSFAAAPVYALPPVPTPDDEFHTCVFPPCRAQRLGNGEAAIVNPLITNFDFANPNQFVTNISGASSDPKDIVQLVDDAVTVWRYAFQDIPNINLNVGWANFGVLKKINREFLSGNLIGGIQKDCEDDDPSLGFPSPTELPAVSGEIIGIHICGAQVEDLENSSQKQSPCTGEEAKEATILFNSELLRIREQGKKPANVKLFLDTEPFRSSAFGPIETVGNPGLRLKRSFEFSDPYVVDLFTVALHEVGHALGYSEANGVSPGHIGTLGIPDVLSPYIPFSTRKCPSEADIRGLIAAGPSIPIPGSSGYRAVSGDPCGCIVERDDYERLNSVKFRPFLKKKQQDLS